MAAPAPMAEGGAWIALDGRPVVYATHEAHIRRLLSEEGGRIVADPRPPVSDKPEVAAPSTEDALRAELAEMRAQMAMLLAERNTKQENEQPDASTLNHESVDNTRAPHDRRSVRK